MEKQPLLKTKRKPTRSLWSILMVLITLLVLYWLHRPTPIPHIQVPILTPSKELKLVTKGSPVYLYMTTNPAALSYDTGNVKVQSNETTLLVHVDSDKPTHLYISLPNPLDINIDMAQGSIDWKNANQNNLDIKIGTGNVLVYGLQASSLNLKVDSGAINLWDTRVDTLNLVSGRGDVNIHSQYREAVVDGNGRIVTVMRTNDNSTTTINNKSGTVNSRIVGYRGSFAFETKGGNIKVIGDLVNAHVKEKAQSRVTGYVGKEGNVFNIDTDTGDINTVFE